MDLNDVLALFDNPRDNGDAKIKEDERMSVSSLWFMSGKTVTIRKDGALGQAIIDYRDTLPVDLAPMVILDASGRVRQTYRDIEQSRGTLVRLKTAAKNYNKLTLHLWQVGGGKSAFERRGDELVAGIAEAINTKPDERWLVVIHRPDGKVGDVEQAVRKLSKASQVDFITWGAHMATNEFVSVSNVILAGTLFYRPSFYEALTRLSTARPAGEAVTEQEFKRTMEGENKHVILQALCRAAVRRCDGEHCHPCDAYIIASVRSGIPAALQDIFPGCNVVGWRPVKRTLKGHVKAAVEFIETWAETATKGDTLAFKEVCKHLGMTAANFSNAVRHHFDFIEAVSELGVVEWGKGQRFTGFALA